MAIVSSVTLSYWRCAFLLTVAFFLVKSPESIVYNTYVLLFGHIFDNVVVDTLAESKNTPIVGLLAIFLTFNALSDLVAIFSISSLFSKPPILDAQNLQDVQENENAKPRVDNKELYFVYFENLVPLRLIFFFTLTAASYGLDNVLIANNLVSIYGFIEVWFNFVIYNNLRDEKVTRYKQGFYKPNGHSVLTEKPENSEDELSDEDETET